MLLRVLLTFGGRVVVGSGEFLSCDFAAWVKYKIVLTRALGMLRPGYAF